MLFCFPGNLFCKHWLRSYGPELNLPAALQEPGEPCGLAVCVTTCASLANVRMETAPAPLLEGTRHSTRKGAALGTHHEQLVPFVQVLVLWFSLPNCPSSLALSFSERYLPWSLSICNLLAKKKTYSSHFFLYSFSSWVTSLNNQSSASCSRHPIWGY